MLVILIVPNLAGIKGFLLSLLFPQILSACHVQLVKRVCLNLVFSVKVLVMHPAIVIIAPLMRLDGNVFRQKLQLGQNSVKLVPVFLVKVNVMQDGYANMNPVKGKHLVIQLSFAKSISRKI